MREVLKKTKQASPFFIFLWKKFDKSELCDIIKVMNKGGNHMILSLDLSTKSSGWAYSMMES